jgi:hypothetical protein
LALAACGDSSAPLGADQGSNNQGSGGACRDDDDCPFGEVCDRGTCEPSSCRDDDDCPSDQRCQAGACQPDPDACLRNSDCDEAEVCDPDTLRCVPVDDGPTPCQSDRECLNGHACVEGACQPEAVACREDRDCPLGQSCDPQGACLPDPCDTSADCPDGFFCHPERGECASKACDTDADCLAALDFCTSEPACGQSWSCTCLEGACEVSPSINDCPDTGPDAPDLPPDGEDASPDLPNDDAPEDAPEDAPTDLPTHDEDADARQDDAAPDLPTHNTDDPAQDPAPDAPEDAPQDTAPDAPEDTAPDAPEDTAPDAPEDVAPDATEDIAPDVPEDVPEDVLDMTDEPDLTDEPDVVVIPDTPDADTGGDAVVMDDPDVAEDVPFTPPPTPAPGTYRYARLPIGGVKALRKVEFHHDGSYAVVLEERNRLHLVDWASREARVLDFTPTQGAYVWEDLRFDPSGDFALLVGWHEITSGGNTTKAGLIVRLDDLAARTGGDATDALEVYPSHGIADPIQALRYPRGGGLPVVLARRNERSPYWAILRDFDPQTGFAGDLAALTTTDAGCDDFDFVNNEFGDPGMLVVCGSNGADTHYYTEVGGVGEWRANPGNNNLGNTSSVAAYPTGDYALVLSWSGRSVYRFEGGALNGYSDAPRFSSRAIHSVKFQQEGQRALIVGGAYFGANEQIGIVVEYRHDLYRCPSPGSNCELTYAHITGFNAPPYNATSNTTLRDSAFRPGCDGGLVVSGFTDFQNNVGQIIEFQIEGARPCR